MSWNTSKDSKDQKNREKIFWKTNIFGSTLPVNVHGDHGDGNHMNGNLIFFGPNHLLKNHKKITTI